MASQKYNKEKFIQIQGFIYILKLYQVIFLLNKYFGIQKYHEKTF